MCRSSGFPYWQEEHHHIRVRYYDIFLQRLSTSITIPRIVTSRRLILFQDRQDGMQLQLQE